MKKIIGYIAVLMIGLSGCTKTGGGTSSATGSMKATVSGASFNSINCYESSGGNYYSIIGNSGNLTITLNIKSNNITTGTYNFDNTNTNNTAAYINNGASTAAVSGSVIITTINAGTSFIGTFSFTCADGTVVTGGTFTAVL